MSDLKIILDNLDGLSDFESRLIGSLKRNGNIFPTTEEEIEQFEVCHIKDIQNVVSKLPSADEILKRGKLEKKWTISSVADEHVVQNMAQAARDGKKLTDVLRQKMLDDRKKSKT